MSHEEEGINILCKKINIDFVEYQNCSGFLSIVPDVLEPSLTSIVFSLVHVILLLLLLLVLIIIAYYVWKRQKLSRSNYPVPELEESEHRLIIPAAE